jgi:hypothetical protein
MDIKDSTFGNRQRVHMNGYQQRASDWMQEFIGEISKPSFSFDAYLGRFRKSADRLAAL